MLIVSGNVLDLADLAPDLDAGFKNLYLAWLGRGALQWEEFKQVALNFFSAPGVGPTQHDRYFNNFTILWRHWLTSGQAARAEDLWTWALEPAIEWEAQNHGQFVHKGTPYYFQGVSAVLRGDLDRAYALMHQSLEEDRRTGGNPHPGTPSAAFITMNAAKPDQFFREWVVDQARFLEAMLGPYRTAYAKTLSFEDLRTQFLAPQAHIEAVSAFAYTVGRLLKLAQLPRYALGSPFIGQVGVNLLFDISLVVDAAIKVHNPTKWKFIDHAAHLATTAGLGISPAQLGLVNGAFDGDFEGTLASMLDGTWAFADGTPLTGLGRDLAVTYGVRNRGAHDVTATKVVGSRFDEVRQCVFSTLFLCVETFY